jgi:competence protein ComEC
MRGVVTRFRAYQLGCAGSSFSHFAGGYFTLLEGRLTGQSRRSLRHEMTICGVELADTYTLLAGTRTIAIAMSLRSFWI